MLPGGRRLHLQHGPIDLVIEAWGEADEVRGAYAQAVARFQDILDVLVAELPGLRSPAGGDYPFFRGPVARRMARAVWPHRGVFITPMAAVAGSVADEVLAAMMQGRDLRRAYVNNGGDIALHLAPGEHFVAGMAMDGSPADMAARAVVEHADPVRGIATSGWGGRSLSLGIADAVTVLAADGAGADAAATLIANAVNADHPGIGRRPACEIHDDSDLGARLVTVAVPALPEQVADAALDEGLACARAMHRRGLIEAACLTLQGRTRVAGLRYIGREREGEQAWNWFRSANFRS